MNKKFSIITSIALVSVLLSGCGAAVSGPVSESPKTVESSEAPAEPVPETTKATEEAKTDDADKSVKKVEDLISGITDVTLDDEKAINEALKEYDALSDDQKKLVSNANTLSSAKEQLDKLMDGDKKKNGWLQDHGISITPQGSFVITAGLVDGNKAAGDIEVPTNVTISETTDGCDTGYKKVIISCTCDVSAAEGKASAVWNSVFDRYTGISYENTSIPVVNTEMGESHSNVQSLSLSIDGKDYDIYMDHTHENNFPNTIDNITITCPSDYDGAVFQIGYGSLDLMEKLGGLDFSSKVYTIDEIPFFDSNGHGYYYLTYTND